MAMWAYPDGIKIFDQHLRVVNDDEPEYSFGKEHEVRVTVDMGINEQPADLIYSFVHTDYSLDRTYYTALLWHVLPRSPRNQNTSLYANTPPVYKSPSSTPPA
jgi:hypothetical protein